MTVDVDLDNLTGEINSAPETLSEFLVCLYFVYLFAVFFPKTQEFESCVPLAPLSLVPSGVAEMVWSVREAEPPKNKPINVKKCKGYFGGGEEREHCG